MNPLAFLHIVAFGFLLLCLQDGYAASADKRKFVNSAGYSLEEILALQQSNKKGENTKTRDKSHRKVQLEDSLDKALIQIQLRLQSNMNPDLDKLETTLKLVQSYLQRFPDSWELCYYEALVFGKMKKFEQGLKSNQRATVLLERQSEKLLRKIRALSSSQKKEQGPILQRYNHIELYRKEVEAQKKHLQGRLNLRNYKNYLREIGKEKE